MSVSEWIDNTLIDKASTYRFVWDVAAIDAHHVCEMSAIIPAYDNAMGMNLELRETLKLECAEQMMTEVCYALQNHSCVGTT